MRTVDDDKRQFKFTDTRLEGWRPDPERDVYLHDTERPNLVLRISPKGAKTFYFYRKDRTRASLTAKIRIGALGEWTVQQARDKVDTLNGATVDAGGVVPKREKPGTVTLGTAFAAYLAEHVATGGRCEVQYNRLYRLYLEPHARLPMDSIDREWITDTIKVGIVNAHGLDAKRTKARKNGGRATANAVLALLSTVFTHHLGRHDKKGTRANPCERVELYPKRPRRLAMDEDEQRRFVNALDTYKREAVYSVTRKRLGWIKGAPIAKKVDLADLLFIALVTGRRRGAIARMKWADLNLDTSKPTWTIPPEDNKAGTEDVVTLHPEIAQLLRERRKRIKGPFALPGALGGIDAKTGRHRLADPRKTFRAIMELAGITRKGLVIHSLRATWITNGLRMKESTEAVRNAVGHASISSTQGYAALVEDDKRRVSDAIGDVALKGRATVEEAA